MRFPLIPVFLTLRLFLGAWSSIAQSVQAVPPTELELKEAAEEEAQQLWQKEDRGIEKQVFRDALADFLKKRDRVAQGRRRYDAARIAKADVQLREANKQVATLEQIVTSGVGIQNEEMERTVSRQLDQLTDREMKIRQAIGRQDPGVSPERQALIEEQRQKELDQIVALRENLCRQKQALETIRTSKGVLVETAQGLLKHARLVSDFLAEDAKRIREEADMWQDYYSGLGKMAEENAAKKDKKKPADTKPATTPVKPAKAQP